MMIYILFSRKDGDPIKLIKIMNQENMKWPEVKSTQKKQNRTIRRWDGEMEEIRGQYYDEVAGGFELQSDNEKQTTRLQSRGHKFENIDV